MQSLTMLTIYLILCLEQLGTMGMPEAPIIVKWSDYDHLGILPGVEPLEQHR